MNNKHNGGGAMNIVGALVTGAAIGAGAVLLSDKKNRDAIKDRADELKSRAREKLNDIAGDVEDQKDKVQKQLSKGLKEAGKRVDGGPARA